MSITWNAPSGATPARYHVYRTTNNITYVQVNGETTTGISYTDASVSGGAAYLYKVRSVDASGNESVDSNKGLATTVVFSDPTITVGSTLIKARHITELRTAINAVRVLAGLSAFAFTDSTITASFTTVNRIHVIELRAALDAARVTLGMAALTYTDATIIVRATRIRAAHITELRNGVK